MKSRTLAMLLLSINFALAAFAQQTGTGSQPAASSAKEDFWDGEEPSFGALLLHPFATKEYVRRHVQPIRDRVNELEEMTASHSKEIKDVDGRAQQGIQAASAKASIADEHAADASTKAQSANQVAAILNPRLSKVETVVGSVDQYNSRQQTEIRFRPGQTALSKDAKDALDQMAGQLKNQRGYIVEVQGFSPGHGQTGIRNSRTVADAVVRYLVLNHEIPAYRIYVLGMGNASADKHSIGTRVEVSLLKNDLDQTAQK
jgi:outer membrane protein OmpA-like peptidoglycan-associated protein